MADYEAQGSLDAYVEPGRVQRVVIDVKDQSGQLVRLVLRKEHFAASLRALRQAAKDIDVPWPSA